MIEIPAAQLGPCYPIRDYGNVLRRKTLYFGRGSKNDVAEPAECHKIIAWFEQAGRAAGPVRLGGGSSLGCVPQGRFGV